MINILYQTSNVKVGNFKSSHFFSRFLMLNRGFCAVQFRLDYFVLFVKSWRALEFSTARLFSIAALFQLYLSLLTWLRIFLARTEVPDLLRCTPQGVDIFTLDIHLYKTQLVPVTVFWKFIIYHFYFLFVLRIVLSMSCDSTILVVGLSVLIISQISAIPSAIPFQFLLDRSFVPTCKMTWSGMLVKHGLIWCFIASMLTLIRFLIVFFCV